MRGNRSVPRGEAGRVARRVRELVGDDGYGPDPDDDEPGRPTWWQRLQARVPVRIDPGRRAAWGVGVAVVLAAVVTGLWLMSSRPAPVPVAARVPQVPGGTLVGSGAAAPSASSRSSAATSAVATTAPAGVVVVDVAGKVRRPGLYRLLAGSRIDDAVKAAGGSKPGVDLSSLNLAAPLADGEQILVGLPGTGVQGAGVQGGSGSGGSGSGGSGSAGSGGVGPGTAGAGPSASGAPAGGPVNLNTATLDQLDALPGIGPALAQRILDWRGAHGRFTGVEQLNDVSGIGDVKFAELKDLVTV